jgi:hypothetical protein
VKDLEAMLIGTSMQGWALVLKRVAR